MTARLAVFALLLPLAAQAARAPERRAQAQRCVSEILAGVQVFPNTSRLKYLGEQAFAASALADHLSRTVDDRRRRELLEVLILLESTAAEPVLTRLLADGDPAVRMLAVRALRRCKSRNARALVSKLTDASPPVRKEAALALGDLRSRALSRALLSAAANEAEPEVRATLLIAVGLSGDRAAARALAGHLGATSESTRLAAARALCLLGDARGLAFANKRLLSTSPVERAGVPSLVEGAPRALAQRVLRPLLRDPDPVVAAAAARALHRSGDPTMLEYLVRSAHGRDPQRRAAFAAELEALGVSYDQREAILARAGARR